MKIPLHYNGNPLIVGHVEVDEIPFLTKLILGPKYREDQIIVFKDGKAQLIHKSDYK